MKLVLIGAFLVSNPMASRHRTGCWKREKEKTGNEHFPSCRPVPFHSRRHWWSSLRIFSAPSSPCLSPECSWPLSLPFSGLLTWRSPGHHQFGAWSRPCCSWLARPGRLLSPEVCDECPSCWLGEGPGVCMLGLGLLLFRGLYSLAGERSLPEASVHYLAGPLGNRGPERGRSPAPRLQGLRYPWRDNELIFASGSFHSPLGGRRVHSGHGLPIVKRGMALLTLHPALRRQHPFHGSPHPRGRVRAAASLPPWPSSCAWSTERGSKRHGYRRKARGDTGSRRSDPVRPRELLGIAWGRGFSEPSGTRALRELRAAYSAREACRSSTSRWG